MSGIGNKQCDDRLGTNRSYSNFSTVLTFHIIQSYSTLWPMRCARLSTTVDPLYQKFYHSVFRLKKFVCNEQRATLLQGSSAFFSYTLCKLQFLSSAQSFQMFSLKKDKQASEFSVQFALWEPNEISIYKLKILIDKEWTGKRGCTNLWLININCR